MKILFAVEKVAHVNSEKDSYNILEKTCAKELNDALHRLKKNYICIPKTPNDSNGNLPLVSFVDTSQEKDNSNKYYKIKVLGVGDLKFISMALGKVNMDAHWCFLCNLSKEVWKDIGCPEGNKWTLESMRVLNESEG